MFNPKEMYPKLPPCVVIQVTFFTRNPQCKKKKNGYSFLLPWISVLTACLGIIWNSYLKLSSVKGRKNIGKFSKPRAASCPFETSDQRRGGPEGGKGTLQVTGENEKYPNTLVLEGSGMGSSLSQSTACHVPWDIQQSRNVHGEEWKFSLSCILLNTQFLCMYTCTF